MLGFSHNKDLLSDMLVYSNRESKRYGRAVRLRGLFKRTENSEFGVIKLALGPETSNEPAYDIHESTPDLRALDQIIETPGPKTTNRQDIQKKADNVALIMRSQRSGRIGRS